MASTRPDLLKEHDETLTVRCNQCHKHQEKHVNHIFAKQNPVLIIGGLITSVIVTVILWGFAGAIGTVSVAIPFFIWKQQSSRIHAFNRYRR